MDGALRERMLAAARSAGQVVHYQGAGTVEFLVSPADADQPAEFYFLEMNTRLQVEHPITEAVLRHRPGRGATAGRRRRGPGIRRVDADRDGARHRVADQCGGPQAVPPRTGRDHRLAEPSGPGIRVDAGYGPDTTVTPHYDSLMAKLIVHGADRPEALRLAAAAVAGLHHRRPEVQPALPRRAAELPGVRHRRLRHRHRRPDARLMRSHGRSGGCLPGGPALGRFAFGPLSTPISTDRANDRSTGQTHRSARVHIPTK